VDAKLIGTVASTGVSYNCQWRPTTMDERWTDDGEFPVMMVATPWCEIKGMQGMISLR
jgi:hypothetical protein